jgi:3-phenylpropionate/trans-cinnamate dioxygenase ferredoxin reductase subunit
VTRLLILGGGPAALSAARGYRAAGGDGQVTLVTPEAGVPYNRPPLSKAYLRGELDEAELPLEAAEFYAGNAIEVRLGDAGARLEDNAVHLRNGEWLRFDTCIVATGAQPRKLPIPGAERALTLRSLADARELRFRAEQAATALVVGSGFVGCEVAASLAMRGLQVTLASDEGLPQLTRLGKAAGERIRGFLEAHRITLELGAPIASLDDAEADLIVMATGITPQSELGAGLKRHNARIVVDQHMRSSRPDVLAAGDVAFAYNASAGRHLAVEHWGEALNMGEVAGRSAAGDTSAVWDVAPGFWSTIGEHTLKYAAWGDGFDEARLADKGGGRFTVWYGREGTTVGVLSHNTDEDYEAGRERVETGAPLP